MTNPTSAQIAAFLGIPVPALWSLTSNPACPAPASTDGAGNLTWAAGPSSTVTISIAAPGVISWSSHGLPIGGPVVFGTTIALPTGLVAGTVYYVSATGYGADSFVVADTQAHAVAGVNNVTTSGSQSGVQSASAPPIYAFAAQYKAALANGWRDQRP